MLLPSSALKGGAVFEGERQATIRVGRGVVQQASPEAFFAFTATPKAQTLEIFGTEWEDGSFHPFHVYSMRQAIEEGFILDVLQNYMTYATCFKIAKNTPENPELPESRATKIIRKLKEHGTEVYFEKENIWTFDSKGELLLTIMSSLAQEERRSISLNVTWGQRKRFADGKATVPFGRFLGYDRGEHGELVINEEEADTVRIIYAEFLAGLSYTAIAKKLTELGIKSPAGNDVWNNSTVKSILSNEKYKGCALLQKGYTVDYLTKKRVKNDGAVPQYYVADSHPAIIEPEVFDRVQDIMDIRSRTKSFSGCTIFSSRIRCGCCGGWFGSKVWHSTDRYRRVIWQCNAKYKDKGHKCVTPHLTEEEVKTAFIRAANMLVEEREWLLADLREIQATYSGTDEREERLRELDERLNAEADAVQELIAENARVAQNQDDYNRRYDEAVSRFETTKAERDALAAEIRQRGIRRREFERFITTLETLPDEVTDFSEDLWGSLVEYLTVYAKDDLRFMLPCEVEITA